MYKLAALICFIHLSFNLHAQFPVTGQTGKLNGRVSSVIEINDSDTGDCVYYDSLGHTISNTYGHSGLCVLSGWFECYGSWNYTYNKKGQLQYATNFYSYMLVALEPDESNDHSDDFQYWYNEKGQLIKEYKLGGDIKGDPGGTTTYEYNKTGKLILEKHYTNQGGEDSLKWEHKYVYNKEKQLTEYIEFEYDFFQNTPYKHKYYKYNTDGNLIESYSKSEKGGIYERVVIVYDSLNRKIKSTEFWSENQPYIVQEYKYGVNWYQKTYSSFSPDGKMSSKSITKYDNKERVIYCIYYKNDMSIDSESVYTYEEDSRGNWIKCTGTRNGEIYCISKREITYYK